MRRYYAFVCKRFAWSLTAFFFIRLSFLVANGREFRHAPWGEIIDALVRGIRFDLSAVLSLLAVWLAWELLPLPWVTTRIWQRIGGALYFILHVPFFALDAVDFEYYHAAGRRMTVEILRMSQDIEEQSGNVIRQFWWVAAFYVVLLFLFFRFAPRFKSPARRPRWWLNFVALPIVGALAVLGIRGTISTRPLAPGHAFRYSMPGLGNVAASTTFIFIKSIQANLEGHSLTRRDYFDRHGPEAARLAELTQPTPGKPLAPKRDNVVLFILESFSAESMGFIAGAQEAPFTPFLDSLARAPGGASFRYAYANARRSINSLPGLLASIPDWQGPPYIMSNYQSNSIYGIGHLLRQQGYATAFFHGAKNGSMGFDYFSGLTGFEKYFGRSEYKGRPEDLDDSGWGVYDEPFFLYAAGKINKLSGNGAQPFGAVIYTLTSHPPYHLPASVQGKYPAGTHPIQPTLRYTDESIRKFFEYAQKQPWYKDTLFIFTGDHTFELRTLKFDNLLGRFNVPLLFFHPGAARLPFPDLDRVTQHLDILPTIADWLGLELPARAPFARSLFADTPGRALLMEGETLLDVHQDWGISFDDGAEGRLFRRDSPGAFVEPRTATEKGTRARLEDELKALSQYFRDGLIDNTLYPDRGPKK